MSRSVLVLCTLFAFAGCEHDAALTGAPGSGGNGAGGGTTTGGTGTGTGTGGNGTGGNGSGGSGGASDGGAAVDGGSCVRGSAGAGAFIPGDTMAPGTACITCHLASKGGLLYIAGTVYSDYHEPDLCLGVSDVKVQITDAQGASHQLDVDASGNFLDNDLLSLWPSPWTVAVTRGAAMRPMVGTVTNGDCNSCHTAAGASNAPGRIIAPDPVGQ